MKRVIVSAISIIVFLCIISACSTVPPKATNDFSIKISSEKGSGLVDLKVLNVGWRTPLFKPEGGIDGVVIGFENKTASIVRIVWDKSSIVYNGNSNVIFLEGSKYIDAGKSTPDMIIPAQGSVKKGIYSASQPSYVSGQYGGWRMDIMAQSITIVLCVESGSAQDFYTIIIS